MPGFSRQLLVFLFAVFSVAVCHAELYQYDDTGRLTGVIYDDGTSIAYTYDAAGNITGQTDQPAVSGNTPPDVPALVSPADGATGLDPASVTLQWNPATDPDGDTVSYAVNLCTDPNFTGCAPVSAALAPAGTLMLAGLGSGSLFLCLGVGGFLRRRTPGFLLALCCALLLAACSSSDDTTGVTGGGTTGGTQLSYTATALSGGTTYFWQVIASDGRGGVTASTVRSFTTR